ncbi:C6 transcription factor [Talaromyces proteolyticus]|uniref:C6 transcription factor n=1 Tax=Talaromyces proteolyticus TaxID=1131652 RepID=A0AAD4Q2I4_9EURO|nr:C6 transcription factor [Talaromyces proteolyticus]KAH8700416.1 C6 transcription factor [Talaromyces proteolyticus]
MASRPRVSRACDRCRRHKLKCDKHRPCTLCVHSNSECEASHTLLQDKTIRRRNRHTTVETTLPLVQDKGTAPTENQHFGVNMSSLEFARSVFGEEEDIGRSLTRGSIPGDLEPVTLDSSTPWRLKDLQLPPEPIIHLLIEAYFCRFHWYIILFHENSFWNNTYKAYCQPTWRRRDLPDVITVLIVAALGLQSVLPDCTWHGHDTFRIHSINHRQLLLDLVSEVRLHLIDLLANPRIEAVQVSILLSCFHMFHNSPNLAWSTSGMAVRTAYALALHTKAPASQDQIAAQIRYRCWNHITVGDSFVTMIYGRPASVDAAFSDLHELEEIDDLTIPPALRNLPGFIECGNITSKLTFHQLKFRLYYIIRQALNRFRLLRPSQTMTNDDIVAMSQAIKDVEASLALWRQELPRLCNFEYWSGADRWARLEYSLQNQPADIQEHAEIILLQAAMLQLLYDGAVILTHRPLLKRQVNSIPPSGFVIDLLQKSLDAVICAALRISSFPVHKFEKHFVVSIIFHYFFMAGVILCIIPTSQPFTNTAQEAKAGVVRIIRASRAMAHHNRIARQTDKLLTELLKIAVQRETEEALNTSVPGYHWDEAEPLLSSELSITKDAQVPLEGPNEDSQVNTTLYKPYHGLNHRGFSLDILELLQSYHTFDTGAARDELSDQCMLPSALSPLDHHSVFVSEQLDDIFGSLQSSYS